MEKHTCDYCGCDKEATHYKKDLDAWLCEEHEDSIEDQTGYCGTSCKLGYGCDESC